MKLEITVTADDGHHLGEALQKVVDRIGVGINKEASATDNWWYSYKIKNKQMRVLIGEFIEFGTFNKDDDSYEVAIVSGEYEIKMIYEEDFDDEIGIRDWIDLDRYNGEIVLPVKRVDLTDGKHKRDKR